MKQMIFLLCLMSFGALAQTPDPENDNLLGASTGTTADSRGNMVIHNGGLVIQGGKLYMVIEHPDPPAPPAPPPAAP